MDKIHVEAIATEPDLGPKLQHRTSKADSGQIIWYLTGLYRAFFSSARNVLPDNGRLAIVLPCINSKSGKIFVNKYFNDYRPVDLFKDIPEKYKDYLKIRKTIAVINCPFPRKTPLKNRRTSPPNPMNCKLF